MLSNVKHMSFPEHNLHFHITISLCNYLGNAYPDADKTSHSFSTMSEVSANYKLKTSGHFLYIIMFVNMPWLWKVVFKGFHQLDDNINVLLKLSAH